MFNFNLPITETLLKPSTRKLTLPELFQAFPEGKNRRGDFLNHREGEVFFSLDPEDSPYGDAMDVVFVDPAIPADPLPQKTASAEEVGSEPSSAALIERIQEDDLFNEGYEDHSSTLQDISVDFLNGQYLLGSLGTRNDRQVFMVDGCLPTDEHLPTAALISIPYLSPAFLARASQNLRESILIWGVNEDDHLFLVLDLYQYELLEKGDGALCINLDSSMRYRKLVRNIMDYFPQKFEYACRDNGVKYDEAWVIDQYGNELPPDLAEEKPLTSTGEGGYVLKTWLHPEDFICCACETAPNGEVRLIYQCLQYEAQGVF